MDTDRREADLRDGTSQGRRVLAALDPSHVVPDERSIPDLLDFAARYGATLTSYGPDDQPDGRVKAFQSFITKDRIGAIAAFLDDPERFSEETDPDLYRPHLTLFLAFLKLLQQAQGELNTLTRRHLDFYYRQFLGMVERGPVADRLNLVFQLAPRGKDTLIPRGSLLSAGPDSGGRDRVYATDRDLVVNRAQLAKLSTVYIDRRFIGFKELRARLKPSEVGLALLALALGDPQPGDPLPLYPDDQPLTADKLAALDALTQATSESSGYFLSLSELRDLFRLKEVLPEVARERIGEQWSKIHALLELGGQRRRKDPTYRLRATTSENFTKNAADALGLISISPRTNLDVETYFREIGWLERYFFLSAGEFHQVYLQLARWAGVPRPDESSWGPIDALLQAAHEAKVRASRRQRLRFVHEARPGLAPLIAEVMEDPSATEDDLVPFLGKDSSLEQLREAAESNAWERVYSILEVVLSNRTSEPVAQIEEWLNLHPAADARALTAGMPGSSRFATFGRAPAGDPAVPPAPAIGWALSAPLLCLSEGERTITLTLALANADPARLRALLEPARAGDEPPPLPIAFALSSDKGWQAASAVKAKVGTYSALSGTPPRTPDPVAVQFQLKLGPGAAPVAPFPPGAAPIRSSWPVLRLMLQPLWSASQDQYVLRYRELDRLTVQKVQLKVEVAGLRALKLQSDEATLDPQKPFEPFGSLPAAGARLLVGHRELLDKTLDSLVLRVSWMGAPKKLSDHYKNYFQKREGAEEGNERVEFWPTARVSWVDGKVVRDLDKQAPLFTADDDTTGTRWDLTANLRLPALDPAASLGDSLTAWPRYLQWELNEPDFQHGSYAALASSLAVGLAAAIAQQEPIGASKYSIKPPYTPKVKSLTLDYSASQELDVTAGATALAPEQARMLHIHPFGVCDASADRPIAMAIATAAATAGVPFLPRYDHDGELYVGLSGVAAPQTVSLLFQLAEGTADPELPPPSIEWSYLDGDRWVPFGSRLLLDTTRGFLNTGIVELALQPAASSTRLGEGLYWLRAAVAKDTAAVCDTLAIYTQAVSATLKDQGNVADHFRQPLPPGSIKKLLTPVPQLAVVRQPYPSYGGRMAEDEGSWATRVSERLRHKQRALSVWDYERLVLDRFPEVYKAKCIPASPDAPGRVEMVIIPNLRNLLPADPFEPKAPARLLADIEAFLSSKTPAFVSVKARNPRYAPVRVRLRVRFRDEGNERYHTEKLNEELNRFLSPWAYEDGADIVLGGRIFASSIVDFVDRRPYVDFVAGVNLFLESGRPRTDYVEALDPDVALVAARTHIIDVLHDAVYNEDLVTGIGFMKIELDFIVGP